MLPLTHTHTRLLTYTKHLQKETRETDNMVASEMENSRTGDYGRWVEA